MPMIRWTQSLDTQVFDHLEKEASKRGTVVTELLRVVVIPEWLRSNGVIPKQEIPKE